MNKAFVREPDDSGTMRCPQCGTPGSQVPAETLDALVPAEARRRIAEPVWFCPEARCRAVYFDTFERWLSVDDLPDGVFPKDPLAPVCACFGLTREQIEDDARSNQVQRVREIVLKAKSPEAQCRLRAASGHSCVAEVQRLYLQHRTSG